jgi:endonuclease YncB( thermonuclease family)
MNRHYSGDSVVINGVALNALPVAVFPVFIPPPYVTTITVPRAYGHYTGNDHAFMTFPAFIPVGGFSQLQVGGGPNGTTPQGGTANSFEREEAIAASSHTHIKSLYLAATLDQASPSRADSGGGTCNRPAAVGAPKIGAPIYRIDHVVDGDTIALRNGQRVRLVQIDTPEVYFGIECYGQQASQTTKRLLRPGARVRLFAEPATDRVDQYGRLLRYVVRASDGMNVNVRPVAVGAAALYFCRVDKADTRTDSSCSLNGRERRNSVSGRPARTRSTIPTTASKRDLRGSGAREVRFRRTAVGRVSQDPRANDRLIP